MSLNTSLLMNLKDDCLKRRNMLKEIMKLSFKDFMVMIDECNAWGQKEAVEMSSSTKMSFYVIPNSVKNFLWRLNAEIEFQKINIENCDVIKTRVLKLQHFLLLYREIKNLSFTNRDDNSRLQYSMMIQRVDGNFSQSVSDLPPIFETHDCSICFNAKPNVMLPCLHSYCERCIHAWCSAEANLHRRQTWQVLQSSNHGDWSPNTLTANSNDSLESLVIDTCNVGKFSCPVCRVKCSSEGELWHMLDKPRESEYQAEMTRNLKSLLESVGKAKK